MARSKGIFKEVHVCLVGLEPLPDKLLYKEEIEDSGFELVLSSACMIKGHFTNACFEEFLKVLKPGGHFAFTIRDIYMNSETDNGMDFIPKLNQLQEANLIKHVKTVDFLKYKGLQFGTGYQEDPAKIMIFQKHTN